jgi:hypothetical protein
MQKDTTTSQMKKILIINGPNLNLLGIDGYKKAIEILIDLKNNG